MDRNAYNIELFSAVPNFIIDDINRYGKIVEFYKNMPAMNSDDTMRYFYFIIEGRIKVYQFNFETSKEQTIKILSRGDMFDVVVLMDDKPHEVVTQAYEDTKALRIPIDKVREWIDSNKDFRKLFFRYVANEMRNLEELATDLSLLDTSSRFIKLLLKNFDPSTAKLKLIHDLPHEELASLIGTVRHVVNRHIQELKKDGSLEVERKKIKLNNIAKLIDRLQLK
ncbi:MULTISPECIES: Crp/Fnr family transcriptional regulator [unclassified Nitratiruptor]|uniref:Crp/Fnr family transcriptional regulator n=1 Tax=unclassified Nitratiruptor TaxID=2624044 RepID=UPI0001586E24|nr:MULTISPECIES: Crp/Fnr family transcriptional regulator [unclassified Nitratiruptor]BAF69129.1 transcriptional regulator [Nitratiruptor sp. SB155-2]BCD59279.1 CRP/FNR family transcriptional regulator, cyclic AMP receptor protein [Nitratiruptor sp. YY08-10]BCD63203.1 CRP/FNR family transcriptional regulator, cyclic AMP receptor protein [Nitratiruptor sp. YY08-14]